MAVLETGSPNPASAPQPIELLDAPLDTPPPEAVDGSDETHTIHAVRLLDFSYLFAGRFYKRAYGDSRARRLRLTDPDGPSTAGGKQARRSLLLAPDDGGRDILVIGWVDTSRQSAEIRTYDALEQNYGERFGHRLDLTLEQYAEVIEELSEFLRERSVDMSLIAPAPPAPAPVPMVQPRPSSTWGGFLLWVVGLLTGFCGGYACFG